MEQDDMQKRSKTVKSSGHTAFPAASARSGPAKDAQRILDLVDTADPAWPGVAAVLQEFKAAGIELDGHSVAMAVKLGHRRQIPAPSPDLPGPVQGGLASSAGSIVYYMRRGSLIKIGTTANPYNRFRDLFPDEILAFEPGDRKVEQSRHRQFRHLRADREYFRDEAELRLHVSQTRLTYGDPDPAWPSAANGYWLQPEWPSAENLTAAEAESELGIKRGTIRVWVNRGHISPVGTGDRRQAHYYRKDELIALRDSPATRNGQRL